MELNPVSDMILAPSRHFTLLPPKGSSNSFFGEAECFPVFKTMLALPLLKITKCSPE